MKRLFAGLLAVLLLSAAGWAGGIDELKKAAGRGDPWAQTMLGVKFATGKGVPQDSMEAVKWFRVAAEQGYPDGQYNLGYMYANGQGTARDYEEAVSWYRKAAVQGYADAQFNLGGMYVLGRGVPQSMSEAYFWLTLAAAQDPRCAENRDRAAAELTPAQREEVKARCRRWMEYFEKRKANQDNEL